MRLGVAQHLAGTIGSWGMDGRDKVVQSLMTKLSFTVAVLLLNERATGVCRCLFHLPSSVP